VAEIDHHYSHPPGDYLELTIDDVYIWKERK
jgi:hypothetical protein